jgi:hypothetical protein
VSAFRASDPISDGGPSVASLLVIALRSARCGSAGCASGLLARVPWHCFDGEWADLVGATARKRLRRVALAVPLAIMAPGIGPGRASSRSG